jgi:hypothetical protein
MQGRGEIFGRRWKRSFGILFAALATVLITISMAKSASTAENRSPTLSVSSQTTIAGSSVSIAGSGLGRRARGSMKFDGATVARFKTNSVGKFFLSWKVPLQAKAGNHVIKVSTASGSASVPLEVSGSSVALGAYVSEAPGDLAKLDEFTDTVGAPPAVVMWYQDWAHGGASEFDDAKMEAVASRSAMPMVTWEPWDYTGGSSQSAYTLDTIVAGEHDTYIRRWARDAATWGKPMYLRFAHEMNGNWYPWSPGVDGNTSAEYVAAWRHVVDIFRQEEATNVRWVWSPNVAYEGSTPFEEVYPGDTYVDWVGLDGYNWGASMPWSSWTALADLFKPSYDALAATKKPMMIAETASAESGGDKSAWIRQGLMEDLPSELPQVRAVVWFDENKETDWRVDSSSKSLAAYREVATASSYKGRLP